MDLEYIIPTEENKFVLSANFRPFQYNISAINKWRAERKEKER